MRWPAPLVWGARAPGRSSRTRVRPRPSPRAGEDHPERTYDQAIVRASDTVHVAHLEGQRHRKALLRHEQARMVGQAQLQRVEVRRGLRLQLLVVEAALATALVLARVRI